MTQRRRADVQVYYGTRAAPKVAGIDRHVALRRPEWQYLHGLTSLACTRILRVFQAFGFPFSRGMLSSFTTGDGEEECLLVLKEKLPLFSA